MRYIYLAVTVLIFGGGLNLSAADKETNKNVLGAVSTAFPCLSRSLRGSI
ncbi:MAG: hypothetical protein JWM16_4600 [Verrucomicrobiales bacterium]|nr:hypothetical protein [Verrucomicrobiales bacterium]